MFAKITPKLQQMLHPVVDRTPAPSDGPFQVIRASAGSGKTFRLVEEYLKCCLRAPVEVGVRQVLAITFTKKAAQEMRTRIVEYVAEVAAGQGAMFDALLQGGEWTPEALQASAAALQAHMLHHYEDFSVMTIDSFVSRLVRVFARDLRLENDFEVELSLEVMVEGTVDRLLAQVGTGAGADADVTELLRAFARNQVEDDSDVNLRGQLVKLAKLLAQERIEADLGVLATDDWTPSRFHALQNTMRQERKRVEQAIREAAGKLRNRIEKEQAQKLFAHGDLYRWVRGLAQQPSFSSVPAPRLQGQLDSGNFMNKHASAADRAKVDALKPEIEALHAMFASYYLGEAGRRNRLKESLGRRVGLVGTMAMLRQEMEALQQEENVRLLQSLNGQIASVIRENPTPFLYERLGTRYRHLFIDEFQDTSVTQWHNLVPLYHEALSSHPDNRTLVVGDAKQAIYRWRNGDYEQLQRLPDLIGTDLPEALRLAEQSFHRHLGGTPLQVNRRSLPEVIGWNNLFFGAMQSLLPAGLSGVYDDLRQEAWRPGTGLVRVESATRKKPAARDAARNRWIVERVAAHGGGEVVRDEAGEVVRVDWKEGVGRPLNDIAILVRTNKEGANIAQFLLSVHISPFTEESLLLGRHPLPLAVVALMRSLLEPSHPAHALTFVQCYCALFPDAQEAELLARFVVERTVQRGDGTPFTERYLDLPALLREVKPEMDLARFQLEPLVVLMGHLLEHLDGLRRYAPYAEALLDGAYQLKGKGKGGIPGFLKAWDLRLAKSSISARASAQSVQVMTVHKSKGLAFPVVLLPMSYQSDRSFKSEIPARRAAGVHRRPAGIITAKALEPSEREEAFLAEYERTLLDAVNVGYVGMTRPRDVLDIFFDWEPVPAKAAEKRVAVSEVWEQAFQGAFGLPLRPVEGENLVYHSGPGGGLEAVSGGVVRAEGAPESETAPGGTKGGRAVVELEGMRVGMPVRQRAVPPERPWWSPEGGRLSPRERGKQVHRLLSQLPDREAWPGVRAVLEADAGLGATDVRNLVADVERILALPSLAPFFEPGSEVHTERAFAGSEGQIFIPDRLIRTPTGWAVLDFKTGKPRPSDEAQVAGYMRQIAQIETGEVTGWICYLESGTCVAVQALLF